MEKLILYTFIAFTLLSCGGTEGRFRLKGEFEHLRQGEFYLYSNDGGTKSLDTLHLELGEFDYETDLDGEATYVLLYPNFSEQVIFGKSGDVIKLEGDARNLKRVKVSGSPENEELTAFRLENIDKSPSEILEAAAKHIEQFPSSKVSVYLFKQYFLVASTTVDAQRAEECYRMLCEAQPDNLRLLQWQDEVQRMGKRLVVGDTIPDFELIMRDSTLFKPSDYRGKPLLINFWASWESESSAMMFRIKRWKRNNPDKMNFLSISLDVNKTAFENIERIDSVTWQSYCDFESWNSSAVQQFDIPNIPYCILVGSEGNVLAVGATYDKDIQPELKKIIDLR